jgi:hypothetical protein
MAADPELIECLREFRIRMKRPLDDPRCRTCGQPISVSNLGAIYPDEGYPKFACTSPFCIRHVWVTRVDVGPDVGELRISRPRAHKGTSPRLRPLTSIRPSRLPRRSRRR